MRDERPAISGLLAVIGSALVVGGLMLIDWRAGLIALGVCLMVLAVFEVEL